MSAQNYEILSKDLTSGYHDLVRTDVLGFLRKILQSPVSSALDVGCGEGRTGEALVHEGLAKQVSGIEGHKEAARSAESRLSAVYSDDLNDLNAGSLNGQTFDLILCADVLEHLYDPWTVLAALTEKLNTGGRVVASIPNLRFISTLWDLNVKGLFDYHAGRFNIQTGHIRFFTKHSMCRLFESAGLKDVKIHSNLPWCHRRNVINIATAKILEDFLTSQYFIVGSKA